MIERNDSVFAIECLIGDGKNGIVRGIGNGSVSGLIDQLLKLTPELISVSIQIQRRPAGFQL